LLSACRHLRARACEEFAGFNQSRVRGTRLLRQFNGFHIEAVRSDDGKAEQRARISRLEFKSFLEQLRGLSFIEAFEEQPSPSDAQRRVLRTVLDRGAELIVGLRVALKSPKAFGAGAWVGASREVRVATARGIRLAAAAQGGAILREHTAGGEDQQRRGEFHLSNSAWVFARSTSSAVNCLR
jgi:hypothetical protein